MIDVELWRAKADAIAAFAGGPAMMIDDVDERDSRIASILVLIDIEYEAAIADARITPIAATRSATITDIHKGEIHASNSQINWGELVEYLVTHPSKNVRLKYDKHHTAVVTAGRTNKKYPSITALCERDGDAGIVILSAN